MFCHSFLSIIMFEILFWAELGFTGDCYAIKIYFSLNEKNLTINVYIIIKLLIITCIMKLSKE